jgi:PH (Pleckstrin Homology) domain-containing protein
MAQLSNAPSLGIAARRMADDRGGARGESAVRTRPHVVYFSGALGFAAFVALVVTLLIAHNDLPAATDWRIVGWGVLATAAGFVGPLLRWTRTWIELDQQGLRCRSGLLRRRSLALDFDRMRALTVEQSFLGRWLGYGHVRVVDDAGGDYVLPPVAALEPFRSAAARVGRRARRDDRA